MYPLGQKSDLTPREMVEQSRAALGLSHLTIPQMIEMARTGQKVGAEVAGAHNNVEIKARCPDPEKIRRLLKTMGATYHRDRQLDTYLNCPDGRMKLREGDVENYIVHYRRNNQAGPKRSEVTLFPNPPEKLKTFLKTTLGVKIAVDKNREVYFIGNVKFHIDRVEGLDGWFVEIEAIDRTGLIGLPALQQQCQLYVEMFGIKEDDLLTNSYSDMLIDNQPPRKYFVQGYRAMQKRIRKEKEPIKDEDFLTELARIGREEKEEGLTNPYPEGSIEASTWDRGNRQAMIDEMT